MYRVNYDKLLFLARKLYLKMKSSEKLFDIDIDMTNKFVIDWFSFTTRIYDLNYLFAFLGLNDIINSFEPIYGVGFYKSRLYFGGINIYYASDNPSNACTIWIEMSGHGCRTFETYSTIDFVTLFRNILTDTDNYNVTRLDVAYDDFDGVIPLKKLYSQLHSENYVSKFNYVKGEFSIKNPGFKEYTCNIGSPCSDIRFRVYDKASERGYYGEIEKGFTWTRWEMQLRDNAADNYMSSVINDNESVGVVFRGVLLNYFRVVDVNKNDSNKRRWKTSKWYEKFIGEVEKISLFTPCDSEYNLSKCENYVYRIAGNAVYTLIEIKGIDKFIEELKTNKSEIKLKYQDLINTYKDNPLKKHFKNASSSSVVSDDKPSLFVWNDIHDVHACEECGNVVRASDDSDNIFIFNGRFLCYHCYQIEFHKFMLKKREVAP